ncbi:hypothetical protein H9Q69_005923 [Fusarium xylarioides]|uniref:Uncharacterized protein n=1 Tax=Fusarium xylarioides TaxID=221167 RepID=A0A9P7HSB9_9HYPO|nr:hypothetical protein H9Q70_013487 [Fusarium xylarioides]KAG5765020.1 hypothetical protein H9Q72_006908 [Fusarium xylarioides]KAG5776696.1 hypothetical protein H9Q73_009629 [Fusarium xylarioides]KAG5795029.1 hypothetical protein H9Q69_005923 [Fusarium xylarioides]
MASNNRSASLGSAGVDHSPFNQQLERIGEIVADMVDYGGQVVEDRTLAHFSPIIAELKTRLEAANGRVAHLEARLKASEAGATRARADAEAHIARYTTELEARNMQMVDTVSKTVEKMKMGAAARVAAAKTHAQDRIDECRDKTDSQIRQLSRDLERHIEMLGLARKHTGWVAHKLFLLLNEVKKKTRLPDKTALAHCLKEMFEELAEYRNDCDVFLNNGLVDDGGPDWGPVPDDESGALLNKSYRKLSGVTSADNTEEHTNRARAPVSSSDEDTVDEQASREESSLFIDDQQSDPGDQSCTIKSEDCDENQQTLTDSSPSTKRASDSHGRARRGGKRQRTK